MRRCPHKTPYEHTLQMLLVKDFADFFIVTSPHDLSIIVEFELSKGWVRYLGALCPLFGLDTSICFSYNVDISCTHFLQFKSHVFELFTSTIKFDTSINHKVQQFVLNSYAGWFHQDKLPGSVVCFASSTRVVDFPRVCWRKWIIIYKPQTAREIWAALVITI